MLTKEEIQKIEELERQKKILQSEISAIKNNTTLDFRNSGILNSEVLEGALRNLVLIISASEEFQGVYNKTYIAIHRPFQKIKSISKKHIIVCNDMLKEFSPIINKYVDIMVSINKEATNE